MASKSSEVAPPAKRDVLHTTLSVALGGTSLPRNGWRCATWNPSDPKIFIIATRLLGGPLFCTACQHPRIALHSMRSGGVAYLLTSHFRVLRGHATQSHVICHADALHHHHWQQAMTGIYQKTTLQPAIGLLTMNHLCAKQEQSCTLLLLARL